MSSSSYILQHMQAAKGLMLLDDRFATLCPCGRFPASKAHLTNVDHLSDTCNTSQ